jgi:hypothetical protein
MQIRPSGIISTNDMAAMAVGHERWGSAEQKKKKKNKKKMSSCVPAAPDSLPSSQCSKWLKCEKHPLPQPGRCRVVGSDTCRTPKPPDPVMLHSTVLEQCRLRFRGPLRPHHLGPLFQRCIEACIHPAEPPLSALWKCSSLHLVLRAGTQNHQPVQSLCRADMARDADALRHGGQTTQDSTAPQFCTLANDPGLCGSTTVKYASRHKDRNNQQQTNPYSRVYNVSP